MKKIFLIFLFLLLITASNIASARDWKRLQIPGAKCGNGSEYSIFIDLKSPTALVIELMGGGACWSASTCYGPNLRTWMYPIPEVPAFSVLSSESPLANKWKNYSYIYFPYCTGDVYTGNHEASYFPLNRTYHYGARNIKLALEFLTKNKIIDFKNLNEVLFWGASAGAIGSLVHTKILDQYIKPTGVHKVVIADSAGLHFGQKFWNKFTPETYKDFEISFANIGLKIQKNDGLISKGLPKVFETLSDWQIGILQGTRDIVMSAVFGDISPEEQEKNILGPCGVEKIAENYSNVETWIKKTYMHTFLIIPESATLKSEKNESAIDFIFRVSGK
ncbi:MAG: pectin acetylesterase-family hydrolase [Bacteriovorax sp.]|nr:pectin acetylesterase-family hydrolase [Bacteriovorax sp.]